MWSLWTNRDGIGQRPDPCPQIKEHILVVPTPTLTLLLFALTRVCIFTLGSHITINSVIFFFDKQSSIISGVTQMRKKIDTPHLIGMPNQISIL